MSTPISIIIPAYNEGPAVAPVLEELKETLDKQGITAEIIVVDDGSADDTGKNAYDAGARVIRHRRNRGYGASLKTGIAAATHDIVAITDADGTYPAKYLPEMIKALDRADMVVGARTGDNVNIPLVRRPAKWCLNMVANYVTAFRIQDLNSGLRVFRRNIVMQYFSILPDQFSWTTTITMAMLCDRYSLEYIPIDYLPRKGKSKIVAMDAGNFLVLILRMAILFRPLRVFLPIVGICFSYGIVKTCIDMWVTGDKNISITAILGLLSALLVLLIGMLGDALATRLGRLNTNNIAGVDTKEAFEYHPDSHVEEESAASHS